MPVPTAHYSPRFQPVFTNTGAEGWTQATDEYNLGSDFPFAPAIAPVTQHGDMDEVSQRPLLNTTNMEGPEYDPKYLSPATPTARHSRQGEPIRHGVDPLTRDQLQQTEVPSLEDQDRAWKLEGDLNKVQSWLETSTLHDSGHSTSRARGNSAPSPRFIAQKTAYQRQNSTQPRDGVASPQMPASRTVVREKVTEDEEAFLFGESTTPPAPLEDNLASEEGSQTISNDERFTRKEPWTDVAEDIDSARIKEQPPSSNAAISLFMRKAKDLETASLTATLGSRRRSETDLNSLYSRDGTGPRGIARITAKSPNPIKKLFTGRNSGSAKKRKESEEEQNQPPEIVPVIRASGQNPLNLKRVRSKSPKPDTSPEIPTTASPNVRSRGMSVLQRIRSKSDLSNPSATSHIAQQWWRTTGGPPVPNLRTQEAEDVSTFQGPEFHQHEGHITSPEDVDADDEEVVGSSASMHFNEAPNGASKEAFKAHAGKLNPRIELYMLDRLTQEQDKRFRRLVDCRQKHDSAINRGNCPSNSRCNALGSGPKYLTLSGNQNDDNNIPTFFVTAEPTDGVLELGEKANFPEGIPLPPVERLPAEFECPLCFQVKKISKPSDWTKHVNEDIQPFTCTFPNCGEAKSFKRKADWVRHESERHRHLEAWQCDLDGCSHRCYRRDNFVQHLVREHRLPEPSNRITRNTMRGTNQPFDQRDQVPYEVERCRQESQKRPVDEPCRFCGAKCESWKRLSVHLAVHMQQISIPILKLLQMETSNSVNPDILVPSGRSQSVRPRTPTQSSHTPGSSQPGSGTQSNLSMSSTGGHRTTSGSAKRTGQTPDLGSVAAIPSSRGWLMQGTNKNYSRYPVNIAPGTPHHAFNNSLNVTMAPESARSPSGFRQPGQTSQMTPNVYSQHLPQNTGLGIQTHEYLGGTMSEQSASMVPYTFPPPGMSSQSMAQVSPPQVEVTNVLEEGPLSTSPIDASTEEFSTVQLPSAGSSYAHHDHIGTQAQPQTPQYFTVGHDENFPMTPVYGQQTTHDNDFQFSSMAEDNDFHSLAPDSNPPHSYPPQYYQP